MQSGDNEKTKSGLKTLSVWGSLSFIGFGLILFLIPIPHLEPAAWHGYPDKLVHVGVFAALPFVFRFKVTVFYGLSLVFIGVGLELLQEFIPGRTVSLYDLIANCIGVGIGCFLRHYRRHS